MIQGKYWRVLKHFIAAFGLICGVTIGNLAHAGPITYNCAGTIDAFEDDTGSGQLTGSFPARTMFIRIQIQINGVSIGPWCWEAGLEIERFRRRAIFFQVFYSF